MEFLANRVRIIFINCPTLSTEAASYLLLAQNKCQSTIQYEIVHYWIFGHSLVEKTSFREKFLNWASEKSSILDRRYRARLETLAAPSFNFTIQRDNWYEQTKKSVEEYDKWFNQSPYSKYDSNPTSTIVVTETKIDGCYIGLSRNNIALISLANWKKFFNPGSALEYLLRGIQRYALRLCYGNVGSHFVTRGCIWDFHVYQRDTKISGYLGFLCSTCKNALKKSAGESALNEIEYMISNEWIGETTNLSSVAAIMQKNYNYDLKRSSGLHTSLFRTITNSMKTEIGKFFFDILKVALAALATFYIASHFPDWYKILKGS